MNEIKLERVRTSDPNLVLAYQTIDDLRKQIAELERQIAEAQKQLTWLACNTIIKVPALERDIWCCFHAHTKDLKSAIIKAKDELKQQVSGL